MPPKELTLDPSISAFTPTFNPKKSKSNEACLLSATSPSFVKNKPFKFTGYLHKEGNKDAIPVAFKNSIISSSNSNFAATNHASKFLKIVPAEIARDAKRSMTETYDAAPAESVIYHTIPSIFCKMSYRDPVALCLPYFTPSSSLSFDKLTIKAFEEESALVRCIKFYKKDSFDRQIAEKIISLAHPNILSVHKIVTYPGIDTELQNTTMIVTDFIPCLKTVEKMTLSSEDLLKILLNGISVINAAHSAGIYGSVIHERSVVFISDSIGPIFLGIGKTALFSQSRGDDWQNLAEMIYRLSAILPHKEFSEDYAEKIRVDPWVRKLLSTLRSYKGDVNGLFEQHSLLGKAFMDLNTSSQIDLIRNREALIGCIDNGEILRIYLRLQRVLAANRLQGTPLKELELFQETLQGTSDESLAASLGRVHQYLSLFLCSSALAIKLEKRDNSSRYFPLEMIVVTFAELKKRFDEAEYSMRKN